ncbi:MAG: response regulator [Chloroflexota bacterium]|nr:response regulator [Chloroflexota bacterium]
MPTDKPRKPAQTCWNCERDVDHTVTVTLRSPSNEQAILPLCRDCYASSYLPVAAEAREVAPTADQDKTVLVVDDDPDTLWMLSHAFQDEGYAVETAAHGLEALYKACRRMPDVVVLDLRMPVMDGRKFIAAWRRVTSTAAVPIVAISAHERRLTAEELGVQAFLPKPFRLSALIDAVGSLSSSAARQAPA